MLRWAVRSWLMVLLLLSGVAAPSVAQVGCEAPDIYVRSCNTRRTVNLRNVKGNYVILVFLCTHKMVPCAGLGPASVSG